MSGFVLFRIVIPTFLLSIQFILYIRASKWLREKFPRKRWMQWTGAALFLIFNLGLVYAMVARPRLNEFSPLFFNLAVYPFFIWHAATIFIGVAVLISILVKLPFRLAFAGLKLVKPVRATIQSVQSRSGYQSFDASRRVFIRRSMYSLTAASFGASAYGMFIGKNAHEITEATFPIRHLPLPLHGFTIAMVSDIHSSINMQKREMDEYVKLVNSLQCDLIIVTGDFVNSQTEEAHPFAEAFSNLSAPHGVYGVMGNHDFFAPQPEIVAKEVDACGVKLLRNDKVIVTKNGGSFYLIGVDDVGSVKRAEEKLDVAIGHTRLSIPKLAMIHRPYFLRQAADRDIDLVFSGHTHGGQVVLASFGNVVIAPASLASRYVWGKYSLGNTQMYVNRGIGTVGLPIRLNCPPEITKITLTNLPASKQDAK